MKRKTKIVRVDFISTFLPGTLLVDVCSLWRRHVFSTDQRGLESRIKRRIINRARICTLHFAWCRTIYEAKQNYLSYLISLDLTDIFNNFDICNQI